MLIIDQTFFFSTGPASQMDQKQKSRTTKSPLMQDWVLRLGLFGNVCTILHRMQRTVRYNVKVICLIFKTSLTKGHIVRKCLTNVPLDGERWAKNHLVRYQVNFALSKLSTSIKQMKTVLQNPARNYFENIRCILYSVYLGGRSQTTLKNTLAFLTTYPPSVDIFYLMNVDKKWTF